MKNFATGTCDGTGAAINVCLGFRPSYVQVYNTEANSGSVQLVSAFWFKAFEAFANHDEGIKAANGGAPAAMTSNGISEYAGGDSLFYDVTSDRWESAAGGGGSDVEEVYVDGHYVPASGEAGYRCIGDILTTHKAQDEEVITTTGFTIGTDSDLNVNNEQLFWIAWE